MILSVVSVFDKAAAAYSRPFFVPTLGMAIRSFSDEANRADEDNPMYKHPSDYELYHLGSFDDASGTLISLPTGSVLLTTASLVAIKA